MAKYKNLADLTADRFGDALNAALAAADLRRLGIDLGDAKACTTALEALRYSPATIASVLGTTPTK